MSRTLTKLSLLLSTVVLTSLVGLPALGAAPQEAGAAQASATAAEPPASAGSPAPSSVPRLIRFSGIVLDASAKPAQGSAALTFGLYEEQEGANPLWAETQEVRLDAQGHYTALLGANSPGGLPLDLFTTGAARWLGVQPQLPGVGELPRVLLVGVPYALKAADADTLGGKPASAYMLGESQAATSATTSGAATGTILAPAIPSAAPEAKSGSAANNASAAACSSITADGTATANQVAKFTAACTIHQSLISDNGTNVGIGNTSPAAKLDVTGSATVRGTLTLPAVGTATSSTGFNSNPLDALASAFNSSTSTAVSQHFRWQAEPVGNNTSSPSGKFNLLFASGSSTPTETGLSISSKGAITLTGKVTAKQLVSNVATGTAPLVVSSTTQVPNLNASQLGGLGASAFAKVGSANTFTGNQSVTGNVSATKQLISTVATGTAPLSVNSTTEVPNLNANFLGGFPASAFAFVAGENTFVPGQFFAGHGIDTVIGDPGCGSGYAAIGFGISNLFGCTSYSILGDGTNTYLNRPSGGAMHFREGNGEQMTINPGGSVTMRAPVGIGSGPTSFELGVTAPNQLGLEVSGPFSGIGAGLDLAPTGGGTQWEILSTGQGAGEGPNLLKIRNINQGINVLTLFGGNVGIGTTSPHSPLEVDTATSDAIGLTVNASAGEGAWLFGGTDSGGFALGGVLARGGVNTASTGSGGLGIAAEGGKSTASGTLGGDAIEAYPGSGPAGDGNAGYFSGNVDVTGNLSKGGGSFKIDHPLDPANKYLYHSFVESPDMKNIYDGVVTMGGNGEAVVQLPDWFAALNRDFRYQLTAIGAPGPNLYIASEVSNNQFTIAGGQPGIKVSWQVTGIRQDAWANAHRIPVEEEKNARERGYYLHPELYGAPEEKGIQWARHPEMMKRMKEHRASATKPVTATQ
jgi:hypothetical protein